MLEDRSSWLDELPDMRVDGVLGVLGVTPQKSGTYASTPSELARCAGVLPHTSEHASPTIGVPEKSPEISSVTPGTPGTPTSEGGWGLPAELYQPLRRLDMHPGRRAIENAHLWTGLVIDAVLFAKDGWAAKALALGWTARELFALSQSGNWAGIAARLWGCDVLALHASAVTIRGSNGPFQLRRSSPSKDAVMIWELGM